MLLARNKERQNAESRHEEKGRPGFVKVSRDDDDQPFTAPSSTRPLSSVSSISPMLLIRSVTPQSS
jgi:hypothetical protein